VCCSEPCLCKAVNNYRRTYCTPGGHYYVCSLNNIKSEFSLSLIDSNSFLKYCLLQTIYPRSR
jgi:hypothetical protein